KRREVACRASGRKATRSSRHAAGARPRLIAARISGRFALRRIATELMEIFSRKIFQNFLNGPSPGARWSRTNDSPNFGARGSRAADFRKRNTVAGAEPCSASFAEFPHGIVPGAPSGLQLSQCQ